MQQLPVAYSSIGEQPGSWKISGAGPDYATRRYNIMIRVIVNDGDKIDRALKQFNRKCNNTKLVQQLRGRQEFEKPSAVARKKRLKAEYIQRLRNEEE